MVISRATGRMKRLHFLTANGFPKALYRPVIAHIEKSIMSKSKGEISVSSASTDVFEYIDENQDWTGMVNCVIREVETRMKEEGPVIGVGHSLGGALFGAAATARPDLFSSLVLIDPPLFNPLKRSLIGAAYCLPKHVIYKMHPMISKALKKPDRWASREEAEAFLKSKRLFSRFDPEVLRIFINECVVPDRDSVSLLVSTAREAAVYYHTPPDIPGHFRKNFWLNRFNVPGTVVYSDSESLMSPYDVWWLKQSVKNLKAVPYRGGHFWCLEAPVAFADYISDVLLEMN